MIRILLATFFLVTASEPPPPGTAVIQLIIKHQLPVSMSTKPDFSDYVDDKGVSRPRPR